VEEATGYLLELQCENLRNGKDADNPNRFVVMPLSSKTLIYNFQADKMPKGKWRWRVHALSQTAFLGQMDTWRTFIYE